MPAQVLPDRAAQRARLNKTPCRYKIPSIITSLAEMSRITLRKYPTVLPPVSGVSVAVVALGTLPGVTGDTDTWQGGLRPEDQVRERQ